jgi:multidrug transporter EmrE-like cation transporter
VDATAWAGLLYSAFLSIGLAYLLWYRGVERIGGARTAVFSNVTPVVALITGWLWLGEALTPLGIAGAAMVLAGLMTVASRRLLQRKGAPWVHCDGSGRAGTSPGRYTGDPLQAPEKTRPRLYLIDGYALIYRAFFALISRPLITSRGENTSAAWGVTKFLLKVLEQHEPEYLGVVFDAGMSERHEIFPEYKATREKMPTELEASLPRVRASSRRSACRCSSWRGTRPTT